MYSSIRYTFNVGTCINLALYILVNKSQSHQEMKGMPVPVCFRKASYFSGNKAHRACSSSCIWRSRSGGQDLYPVKKDIIRALGYHLDCLHFPAKCLTTLYILKRMSPPPP